MRGGASTNRLEKMVCSSHFLQGEPDWPNEVISEGEISGHRQEPAVQFTGLKLMQQLAKEDFCPVLDAFTNLKLTSNAALQAPAFAGLREKTGTGLRSQGLRSAIDL